MKRILIFSDTHGYIDPCISVIEKTAHVSAVVHAGDCARDAEDISYIYPGLQMLYVRGNNDFLSNASSSVTTIIDGVRIFITHGHEQRVKYESRYETLRQRAKKEEAQLVVFGHTHTPYTGYEDDIIMLNPGSVRYSRTYAVCEIENGTVKTKILDI